MCDELFYDIVINDKEIKDNKTLKDLIEEQRKECEGILQAIVFKNCHIHDISCMSNNFERIAKNIEEQEGINVEFIVEFNNCYIDHGAFEKFSDVCVYYKFCNCNLKHMVMHCNNRYLPVDFEDCKISQSSIHCYVMSVVNCELSDNTFIYSREMAVDVSGTNMLNPIEYMDEHFEKTDEGYIVYKVFNRNYHAPDNWNIAEGSIIEETVNQNPFVTCACGINVGTKQFIQKMKIEDDHVWKCLIKYEWACGITVPYNTNGKIRCCRLQLLNVVDLEEE